MLIDKCLQSQYINQNISIKQNTYSKEIDIADLMSKDNLI